MCIKSYRITFFLISYISYGAINIPIIEWDAILGMKKMRSQKKTLVRAVQRNFYVIHSLTFEIYPRKKRKVARKQDKCKD